MTLQHSTKNKRVHFDAMAFQTNLLIFKLLLYLLYHEIFKNVSKSFYSVYADALNPPECLMFNRRYIVYFIYHDLTCK